MYDDTAEPVAHINPTAVTAYERQGPGVGAGGEVMSLLLSRLQRQIDPPDVLFEIGFGQGELMRLCAQRGVKAFGGEVCDAAFVQTRDWALQNYPDLCLPIKMDASHDLIPLPDDSVSIVACTETIEHLGNPIYALSEAKRVLQHDGLFVLAFPMPESNLGYGGGKHAHVYPGFLLRDPFERFMKQLFFKLVLRWENGDSAWYVYSNYKGPGIVDVFHVISGNYEEAELYGVLES